jgi:3-mercaptopyruvate sulfurtransferase SseA
MERKKKMKKDAARTLLAVLAAAITVGAVWYTQRPVASKPATWEDVLAEAEAGGYRLISTEELADRYRRDAPGMLLVDTRQEWEYRTGHIEGAVNFPMEPTWWSRWSKADDLEELLGSDKDRTIVFY